MNREIVWTAQFKKDDKLAMKRHMDMDLLDHIIRALSRDETLPERNKDHSLTGDWVGHRECHIQPDWLLVYRMEEDVLVLTAGVDVQDDRFEVEVVGWGVGKESWGIRYQKIYGDMLKEQVWRDLDAFLTATFSKKDGTQLPILCTCIDSGGHHTDQVYRFTKERYERRIFAIKGKGGQEVPYIRNPSTNNRVKTPLFVLGVDAGKALVYQRLKHEPPERKGPNYCHFPLNEEAGYDEQYFRGLTSEKAVVRFRKGRSVTVWEIKDASYKRNEPLDLRNYATAALEIANPVLKGPEEPEIERRQRATGRRRLSGGI